MAQSYADIGIRQAGRNAAGDASLGVPRKAAPSGVPASLRDLLWIGGGSAAGKSTVARRLAGQYGLEVYACDDQQAAHTRRSTRSHAPLLHAFIDMNMDERWVTRSPEEMFSTWPAVHGEGFELIVEDLVATGGRRIVEGYKLLPRLVAPLLTRPTQSIFLLPTPEFRQRALESRGSTWSIAGRTSDPARALANLLARDASYTDEVGRQATALVLPTAVVDGTLSVTELVARVARSLGLVTRGGGA
jgi:hypothetical protein